MRHARQSCAVLVVALVALLVPSGVRAQDATPPTAATPVMPALPPPSANVAVFATRLDNPRGLKFAPDGTLYVAEGGRGGTTSTVGQCPQVPATTSGPYTGGLTARLSKLDGTGQRTTVVDGLPSSQLSPPLDMIVLGVADVAFIGDTVYALLSGGGCSHGVPNVPNAIITLNPDGTTTQLADISAFVHAHPTKLNNPADFEPDETPYALVTLDGMLYFTEPNHGALDRVDPATGTITRVLDLSASEGHVVPDALAAGPDGNLYVGTLMNFPEVAGTAKVYRITPDGQLSVDATGLTALTGLAFDAQGQLYALETSGPGLSPEQPVIPGTGRVVRVRPGETLQAVATGLVFPTAMTFGPDGRLYVANFGYGFPPGAGQVVTVDVAHPAGATPAASPVA
jgi:sugar lactone lactonase YvrE